MRKLIAVGILVGGLLAGFAFGLAPPAPAFASDPAVNMAVDMASVEMNFYGGKIGATDLGVDLSKYFDSAFETDVSVIAQPALRAGPTAINHEFEIAYLSSSTDLDHRSPAPTIAVYDYDAASTPLTGLIDSYSTTGYPLRL